MLYLDAAQLHFTTKPALLGLILLDLVHFVQDIFTGPSRGSIDRYALSFPSITTTTIIPVPAACQNPVNSYPSDAVGRRPL